MKVGVILTSDDPIKLYEAATYIATELARGNEVVVFVTGRATLAFAGRSVPAETPEVKKMKELHVMWDELLSAARSMGVKIIACETASKIFDVSEAEYSKKGLVDMVSSMYTFLEEVGEGRIVTF
jgi:peroxiredoxin family protein